MVLLATVYRVCGGVLGVGMGQPGWGGGGSSVIGGAPWAGVLGSLGRPRAEPAHSFVYTSPPLTPSFGPHPPTSFPV